MIPNAIRRAKATGDVSELRAIYGRGIQRKRVRTKVVMSLHFNYSSDATELLGEVTRDEPDEEVRALAASMLVDPQRGVSEAALRTLDAEESSKVLKMVAQRLSKDASQDSIDFLSSLLGNSDWHVRLEALSSLEAIGGPRVLGAAIKGLDDPDKTLRLWAVQVIAASGADDAVAIIEAQLAKEDGLVRAEMERALQKAGRAGS